MEDEVHVAQVLAEERPLVRAVVGEAQTVEASAGAVSGQHVGCIFAADNASSQEEYTIIFRDKKKARAFAARKGHSAARRRPGARARGAAAAPPRPRDRLPSPDVEKPVLLKPCLTR